MSYMKEIFASMINDRIADFPASHRSNDYDDEEFKNQFDYHLVKYDLSPGEEKIKGYTLVTNENNMVCTGTLKGIKKYIKLKNISLVRIFNFQNYLMNDQ